MPGQDDWDASEDEAPAPVATGPAPPVRQKGITKQKIAEKEAMERAAAEKRAAQVSRFSMPFVFDQQIS
jgi:translation initiation factor 3 subunit J